MIHVNISDIALVISMFCNILAIAGIFLKKSSKNQEKDMQNEKNFLKINMKLDEFCRQLSAIVRNSDKSSAVIEAFQKQMISMDNQIQYHSKELEGLDERVDKIEERLNNGR